MPKVWCSHIWKTFTFFMPKLWCGRIRLSKLEKQTLPSSSCNDHCTDGYSLQLFKQYILTSWHRLGSQCVTSITDLLKITGVTRLTRFTCFSIITSFRSIKAFTRITSFTRFIIITSFTRSTKYTTRVTHTSFSSTHHQIPRSLLSDCFLIVLVQSRRRRKLFLLSHSWLFHPCVLVETFNLYGYKTLHWQFLQSILVIKNFSFSIFISWQNKTNNSMGKFLNESKVEKPGISLHCTLALQI